MKFTNNEVIIVMEWLRFACKMSKQVRMNGPLKSGFSNQSQCFVQLNVPINKSSATNYIVLKGKQTKLLLLQIACNLGVCCIFNEYSFFFRFFFSIQTIIAQNETTNYRIRSVCIEIRNYARN